MLIAEKRPLSVAVSAACRPATAHSLPLPSCSCSAPHTSERCEILLKDGGKFKLEFR